MVQRAKHFLAVAVIASLLGSSVAWTVALWMAPLGAYEVSLHIDDGRFAIVLDRRAPSDRTARHGDPAMNDGDGMHDEYVVTVGTLEACSTAGSGKSTKICSPAVAVTRALDVALFSTPIPRAVSSRAGPLLAVSFSVLRI